MAANLIVRDAEVDLPRCLRSVESFVDEIVVLDTGSTDRSVEVVQRFASSARVPVLLDRVPWRADFGWARNQTLVRSSCEWVLWIDADESLVGGEDIRRHVESPLYAAFALQQHNVIMDAGVVDVQNPCRLFRTDRGLVFYGGLHEHPEFATNLPLWPWMAMPRARVLHTGYASEEDRREKLISRNIPALERSMRTEPLRKLDAFCYIRDCVNLAGHERHGGSSMSPGVRRRLLEGIELFETTFTSEHDEIGALARPWYERCLEMLGLGEEIYLGLSSGDPGQGRLGAHRLRCRTRADLRQAILARVDHALDQRSRMAHHDPDRLHGLAFWSTSWRGSV